MIRYSELVSPNRKNEETKNGGKDFSRPPIMRNILMDIFLRVFQISNNYSADSYDCADSN